MTTPILLLSGVDVEALASTTVTLQWDLPHAVAVRHHIAVEEQTLERVVSDITGVIEREFIELDHACVHCALREDIIPTFERLAQDGRWGSIIAHLPVGAEPEQVCRVLDLYPGSPPVVHVARVVTCVSGPSVHADTLGDDLLRERKLHTSHDDCRGVAEVAAAMIEYADAVAVCGSMPDSNHDLLSTLARPDALIAPAHTLSGPELLAQSRSHRRAEDWVADVLHVSPPAGVGDAWVIDLSSSRPFHPGRLLDSIKELGGGAHRSRGCFWLPTRPGCVCPWDGAGGQLSVGVGHGWGKRPRLTRIWVTGLDDAADRVERLFQSCLLSDTEIASRGSIWERSSDGFEPWLGPIRSVA